MPENSATNKKPSALLIIIIIVALIFVIGLFIYMSQSKPNLQPQSQPDAEATNSADFNQADRLEATGASLVLASSEEPKITIYSRTTCSHCQAVEAFFKENPQSREKVTIKFLDDIINGPLYSQELTFAARDCGLNEAAIGVPFLYFGQDSSLPKANRCLMGDTPIISYFQSSTN